jgi:6-phosphogluconolactonase
MQFYVGTYTKKEGHVDGKADGIYRFTLSADGLSEQITREGIINPSYLTLDAEQQLLYAVSEIGPDVDSSGQVVAYRIGKDGQLQELNRQPTFGFAPCYVSLHPDGSAVFVANYVGGTIAVYPRQEDGQLAEASQTWNFHGKGPHAEQDASHPHCILPSPDGQYVYVADKGTDLVSGFRWQAGRLSPLESGTTKVQSGSGPRHLAFHPRLPYLYLINELNATVDVFAYETATGALQHRQNISTLPDDYEGWNACADIHLSPDGKSLYASNRGHNSLALFQVGEDGRLTPNGQVSSRGEIPRNFVIAPSGEEVYIANQNSDNIVCYRRAEDGSLTFHWEAECPTPVCLKTTQ